MHDEKEKIDRINELAKKQGGEGLTVEETLEQAELRKEFLADEAAHEKRTKTRCA